MQAATIVVKKERGKLVVHATGRTPKGQKFIKGSEDIDTSSMSDPDFKAKMAASLAKLLEREA